MTIYDVPRNAPLAAAKYYRERREAGDWDPDESQVLAMLQDTREGAELVARLMRAVDRHVRAPPAASPPPRR